MKEPQRRGAAFDTIPITPHKSAHNEIRDALEVAELVRAFKKLDPADRQHILKMSQRLVAWHN